MNKQQESPCVPKRAVFAIVALTAAGIWLSPDPSTWSDSTTVMDVEATAPIAAHGQGGSGLSETSLDPRRDGRLLPTTGTSLNTSALPSSDNTISVEFKVDSPLSSGAHLSNPWVSPPCEIRIPQGMAANLRARALLLDRDGTAGAVMPEWTSSNQEMVTVTRGQDDTVLLTLNSPGEANIRLSSDGASKTLSLKTTSGDAVLIDVADK